MTNLIRRMEVTDCAAVALIDQAVSINPWNEKLFFDCVCVGYECWVMVEKDTVIGFGILSQGANEAHILNLVIEPGHQGCGLGVKMLQHLITVAEGFNVQEVFLEVRVSNTVARNLYNKFHFVEIGVRKGYYPDREDGGEGPEDAITLALSLGAGDAQS